MQSTWLKPFASCITGIGRDLPQPFLCIHINEHIFEIFIAWSSGLNFSADAIDSLSWVKETKCLACGFLLQLRDGDVSHSAPFFLDKTLSVVRSILAPVAGGSAQTYATSAGALWWLRDEIFNFLRCGWCMALAYICLSRVLCRLQASLSPSQPAERCILLALIEILWL